MEINKATLPQNTDVEQMVLGTIIRDSEKIREVTAFLRPKHFYMELHEKLFDIMYDMHVGSQNIDIVTLEEAALRKQIFVNQAEARGYLVRLVDSVVSPSSIGEYGNLIKDKSMIRSLMYACRDIFDLAAAGTEKPAQVMEFAEDKIYNLRGNRNAGGLVKIQPLLDEKIRELEESCKNPGGHLAGSMASSFSMLDSYIHGLNPSDLILIAGRPAMGKTSFALNMAVGAAKLRRDKSVVIFSLEMSRLQLVSRLISSEALVSSNDMRNGQIDSDGWRKIREGVEILSNLQMFFDEGSGISIGEMKSKLKTVDNLGLVVIDYLQLMSIGRRDGNRTLEISEITRNLKLMAKDLDVPVVVASQLSRASETRSKGEKRPVLSDLRESGSIEQDADIVMFLYREHYYNEAFEKPWLAECIVAKNRQGETGTVPLHWNGAFTKFSTLDYQHAE
jgi:replicative DNA helicase